MNWYDLTDKYHTQTFPHECRLTSLPEEWQRELAALWRLEADVNNGAYLQFLCNWGRESYVYAVQALKKIGARKMAVIVDSCQALVEQHFDYEAASREDWDHVFPNRAVIRDGKRIETPASILPEAVLNRIYELSYEFMDYPDDLAQLGLEYYQRFIEAE